MPEVLSHMSGRWNRLSSLTRLLAYAVAAILAFVMAASVGAVAALLTSGNASPPIGETTRPDASSPPGEQGNFAQHDQTTYVDEVGEIQANSVDAFLDSHEKLLRYDALTSGDIDKMEGNQAALKGYTDQASNLKAPRKYTDQREAFLSAIGELHQATQLAYVLAADPISATQDDFDHYDHLVNEAAADLQQSNEILGKNYRTIEGVRGVST